MTNKLVEVSENNIFEVIFSSFSKYSTLLENILHKRKFIINKFDII